MRSCLEYLTVYMITCNQYVLWTVLFYTSTYSWMYLFKLSIFTITRYFYPLSGLRCRFYGFFVCLWRKGLCSVSTSHVPKARKVKCSRHFAGSQGWGNTPHHSREAAQAEACVQRGRVNDRRSVLGLYQRTQFKSNGFYLVNLMVTVIKFRKNHFLWPHIWFRGLAQNIYL